jgi:signal transduction histidine kinase
MTMPRPFARLSRPALADLGIAVALAVLSFFPGLADKGPDLSELATRRPIDALAAVLALAQALPLVVRRRWPVPVFAVVGVAFAAYQLLGYRPTVAGLALLVAIYGIGGRRVAAAVGGLGYVLMAIGLHNRGSANSWYDFCTFIVVLVIPWVLGERVRGWQALAAEVQRAEAAAALADERARIARELHDVVTHHVTAIVVQADSAQFQTDPAAVTTSLESISDTGRSALSELRHLLGVLHAPASADREPVVGRLSDLVDRVRAAGQPVDYRAEGSANLLAGGAELAAYRVVQEGLTNAMKHARGAPTVVTITYGPAETDISITTEGPVVRPNKGHGLTGLHERVAVFGGDLTAGPRPEGGFTIRARIPAGGHS